MSEETNKPLSAKKILENRGSVYYIHGVKQIISTAIHRHLVTHVQVPKEDKRDRVEILLSEAEAEIELLISGYAVPLQARIAELEAEVTEMKTISQSISRNHVSAVELWMAEKQKSERLLEDFEYVRGKLYTVVKTPNSFTRGDVQIDANKAFDMCEKVLTADHSTE